MDGRVAVDSGLCIGLFNRDDEFHGRAIEFVRGSRAELIPNLAVITETMYWLDFSLQAQTDFLAWLRAGGLSLVETELEDFERVLQLMTKYADLPMDFTDALLVAICERLNVRQIASFDRHFSIYRFKDRGKFTNLLSPK